MIRTLRYEFALWSLQAERARTRVFFAEMDRKAVESKNVDKIQSANFEEMHEIQVIDDQIARLQTTFLRNEAQRYLLPMPEFNTGPDGAWEQAFTGAHYQLKAEPLAALRSAIRKEKKERRESWQSSAALLIGVIGSLIGLFSAIKKNRNLTLTFST
jgi:hypothetical protein